MLAKVVFGNAFAMVPAALPPIVMFGLPLLGTVGLPHISCGTKLRLTVAHPARRLWPVRLPLMSRMRVEVLFVLLLRSTSLTPF
jgi:hypothetical protein